MSSLWAQLARGVAQDDDGSIAPRLTNREALSIVSALRDWGKGTRDGFPLWYQFAAVAYGWAPESDTLAITSAQADANYPIVDAMELNREIGRIAGDLDAARHPNPRMQLEDVFDRRETAQDVSVALRQDGASAQFKVPIPACKDPKTGKPAMPVRGKDGKWRCPGGIVTIDDPITAIIKKLQAVAVPLGIILLGAVLINKGKRKKRRRRKR